MKCGCIQGEHIMSKKWHKAQKWYRALFRRRVLVILLLLIQMAFIVYSLLSRSLISTVTASGLSILSVAVCFYIIAREDKEAYKLTWVFLIMLFPLFGGLFYLLFNFQSTTKRFKRIVRRVKAKEAAAQAMSPGTPAAAVACPAYAPQIRYLESCAGFPVYDGSSAFYLSPGEKKFKRLTEELKKAERYIFLEYFIVQEGIMWDTILDILKEKAKAGVTVRLMYDDMGCFFTLPKDYPAQLKKYGIECVVFNPFRPVLTTIQNNRDHRKIAVIDGKVAFTGGINLADEYINAYEKHGHWKDASVMVEGRAAWSFAVMFLTMWELNTGTDEDYGQYYPRESQPRPAAGFVQPYADSPMDKENVGEQVYLSIIHGAKEYLYINTPYLIVDNAMISALCHAAKSGVDVRIVTPHIWDKWFVHMTTRSYYRELIAAGVKIYEYTKGFMHAKTFLADDAIATVGTVNLDYRSLYLHFECGTVLYDCPAVLDVKEDFLKTLNICQPITEQDCKHSLPMRLFQDVMRLFAPLI